MKEWQNPKLSMRMVELDGIRGLAILLVVIWHLFGNNQIEGLRPGSWQAHLFLSLSFTWSGVDLFFVLSGFLIGGILYDARNSESYYKTFYCRRMARIFPVYFVWFALFMVGVYFAGSTSSALLRAIFNDDIPLWTYPLFVQNIAITLHRNWGAMWIAGTWSLAVEEQFYLLLPVLVRRSSKRVVTLIAVGSIVGAPLFRLTHGSAAASLGPYTLLPSRADALGFGVLVAMACRNEAVWTWLNAHRRWLFAAMLVIGCRLALMLGHRVYVYGTGLSWLDAFYGMLLLLTLIHTGTIQTAFFRSRVLVKLGALSYTVYLLHNGINMLLHFAIFGAGPAVHDWASFVVTLLSLAIVMPVAASSWRYFERPIIRWAHTSFGYEQVAETRSHPSISVGVATPVTES